MFYKIFEYDSNNINVDDIGKYRISYEDFSGIYLQT